MDQSLLHSSLLSPQTSHLKHPIAFRVESKGRPPSPSAPIYNGPTLRSIIYGPATLEFATKHLLESESATPFVSVLWIWDRALQAAEKLAEKGCWDIRIFIIDLNPLHAQERVYDAYKLSQLLGFKPEGQGKERPCTENHKGELLLHCGTSEDFCSVLASIPAGMPTIYYDSTSHSGILRLPVEYFEHLSQRLVARSRGGVRKSMLLSIISETRDTAEEETWLDETSARLLQDVLEDDLLEQCQAVGGEEMERIPGKVIKAMTMDVSDYLGLMRVLKLSEGYFEPGKKMGGGREWKQTFVR